MRRTLCLFVGFASLIVPAFTLAADPPRFTFHDGDRVVLLGDTLIERDQKFGYLETILTLRNPDKAITFRNLGWSGDTVHGLARARFGSEADGFNHLKEHVLALKPTVILIGYGMTDSFDGEAGLPRFVSGLNTLLDVLAETKARIVLISPIAHGDLGRPLPDPAPHNKDLERYTAAIATAAQERAATFVDILHEWANLNEIFANELTNNGIHLTEDGYWLFGVRVTEALLGPPQPWTARFHHNGRLGSATGTTVTIDPTRPTGVHFAALDATLPLPRRELKWGSAGVKVLEPRLLVAEGLPEGRYKPYIDGSKVARISWEADLSAVFKIDRKADGVPDDSIWDGGVELKSGPEYDQVEKLRQTINAKNLLYFHRWRPQNETYLFGFRKHEQGNNAREIPLFDPLVEAKEQEIARLRKPVKHTYELIREDKAAR